MGFRERASQLDFSSIGIEEEVEEKVKETAEISMGTEISESDLSHIQALADQVMELAEYRGQLAEYLRARMQALAPNLMTLVGTKEGCGARGKLAPLNRRCLTVFCWPQLFLGTLCQADLDMVFMDYVIVQARVSQFEPHLASPPTFEKIVPPCLTRKPPLLAYRSGIARTYSPTE